MSAVECDLCAEEYGDEIDDRIPRLLACGHTYCQGCLQHWATRATVSSDHKSVSICCPTCRHATKIPATAGADHTVSISLTRLPKNFEVLRIQSTLVQGVASQLKADIALNNARLKTERICEEKERWQMQAHDERIVAKKEKKKDEELTKIKYGTWSVYVKEGVIIKSWLVPFTRYEIVVQEPKGKTYRIFRRYSDFVWLQERMAHEGSVVPALPTKKWLKWQTDLVNERRSALQAFLRCTLHYTLWRNHPDLHAFLTFSTEELRTRQEKGRKKGTPSTPLFEEAAEQEPSGGIRPVEEYQKLGNRYHDALQHGHVLEKRQKEHEQHWTKWVVLYQALCTATISSATNSFEKCQESFDTFKKPLLEILLEQHLLLRGVEETYARVASLQERVLASGPSTSTANATPASLWANEEAEDGSVWISKEASDVPCDMDQMEHWSLQLRQYQKTLQIDCQLLKKKRVGQIAASVLEAVENERRVAVQRIDEWHHLLELL